MVIGKALATTLLPLVAVGSLVACAGIADLDVKYTGVDGATPTPTGDGGPTPADAAASIITIDPPRRTTPSPDPLTQGQDGAGCPCDETQGLGCCAAAGGAFCTADIKACKAPLLRCNGPDLEGSFCCLHRGESGEEAALAATCTGTIVCTVDSDCPNQKCTIGSCNGVNVGTCDGTPVCP